MSNKTTTPERVTKAILKAKLSAYNRAAKRANKAMDAAGSDAARLPLYRLA